MLRRSANARLLSLEHWGAGFMVDCLWTHHIDNDGALASRTRALRSHSMALVAAGDTDRGKSFKSMRCRTLGLARARRLRVSSGVCRVARLFPGSLRGTCYPTVLPRVPCGATALRYSSQSGQGVLHCIACLCANNACKHSQAGIHIYMCVFVLVFANP